jgi:hypothetical protein
MKICMPALRLSAALLLLCSAGLAGAQRSPWYLAVNPVFCAHSNVNRQIDEFAQSRWWSIASLGGGFDQRYGRQRFCGNGNAAANVYRQLSELDNTSYGVASSQDWETVERLSGKLYVLYKQSLAAHGGFNFWLPNQITLKDNAFVDVPLEHGVPSRAAGDPCLARSSVRCSLPGYAFKELDPSSITARVRMQFSGTVTTGVGVAHIEGEDAAIDRHCDRYV